MRAGATAEAIAALEAQRAQAQAALAAAVANLKALDIELERTNLVAPSAGVILQRLVHEGELAAPGAPLFTLADLDEVTLTVYVPEAELGRVALGQAADVVVDAYVNRSPVKSPISLLRPNLRLRMCRRRKSACTWSLQLRSAWKIPINCLSRACLLMRFFANLLDEHSGQVSNLPYETADAVFR